MTNKKTILALSVMIALSLISTGCSKRFQTQKVDTYLPTEKEVEAFENHAEEEHGDEHVYVNAEQLAEYNSGDLSEQEIADIIHMRQEEKFARDVYRTLGKTYAINQFKNIPLSEQQHTDAMELILERYNIEDPIEDESLVGVYQDQKFKDLFQQLTEKGASSLADALTVGATIEDINMAKLLEVMENTDNEDIAFVYESVLEQSHHHMNAFIKGLKREGRTYTPEYVTQDYFDSIIE